MEDDAAEQQEDVRDGHQPPSSLVEPETPVAAQPRTKKTPLMKIVIVCLALVGGVGALASTVSAAGATWTIVGSSFMGVGALLVVVGFCWQLSKSKDHDLVDDRMEVRVVDARQLAELVRQGVQIRQVR